MVARAVEVVAGAMRLEVNVTLQIVGEEAHTAFQRHHHRAGGEQIQLGLGQLAVAALEEALGVGLEQLQIQRDLGKVGLVLYGGVGTEADGIAEVVDGIAGHHGVQVDDANGGACLLVKQDVVELGIVMCDAQWQLAGLACILQRVAEGLALLGEGDLGADLGKATANVLFHGLHQIAKAPGGVVEVLDAFMHLFRRVVRKVLLEGAKGLGAVVKILDILYRFTGNRALGEFVKAPILPQLIAQELLAVKGRDHDKRGALYVATLGTGLAADMLCYAEDVFHQRIGVGEDAGVHTLHNIAAACHHQKGVIDVAVAVGLTVGGGFLKVRAKGVGGVDLLIHSGLLYIVIFQSAQ